LQVVRIHSENDEEEPIVTAKRPRQPFELQSTSRIQRVRFCCYREHKQVELRCAASAAGVNASQPPAAAAMLLDFELSLSGQTTRRSRQAVGTLTAQLPSQKEAHIAWLAARKIDDGRG
jgi:hypothetical protein